MCVCVCVCVRVRVCVCMCVCVRVAYALSYQANNLICISLVYSFLLYFKKQMGEINLSWSLCPGLVDDKRQPK